MTNSNRSDKSFHILIILLLLLIIGALAYFYHIKKNEKPKIVHVPVVVGGCKGTRYGCCPNGVTPRANVNGTNC